jgi:hypothetical protein
MLCLRSTPCRSRFLKPSTVERPALSPPPREKGQKAGCRACALTVLGCWPSRLPPSRLYELSYLVLADKSNLHTYQQHSEEIYINIHVLSALPIESGLSKRLTAV